MKNSNVVLIQIDRIILHDSSDLTNHLKEYSKYFEVFDDMVIIMYHEQTFLDKVDLYRFIDFEYEISLEVIKLNNFAKTRLLNNFDEKNPELVLVIMSCGQESKLMKIKVKK